MENKQIEKDLQDYVFNSDFKGNAVDFEKNNQRQ
jgi:hypothetical protein